jgi:protoporphyrinogen oxidase
MRGSVIIIGAGFTGLAAAYELTRRGIPVIVLEKDSRIGGLAGSFEIDGCKIEKFYHHLFNNDQYIIELIEELGCQERLSFRPTETAIYLDNKFFKLSTPLDLLRFGALNILDRIRLGLLVLKARRIKNWRELDALTAEEWLIKLCGRKVYSTVWEPLLRGKFGPYSKEISVTWIWNKLVLRGGSRDKAGCETLGYYRGGFGALAETIAEKIKLAGGIIQTSAPAEAIVVQNGRIKGVKTATGVIGAEAVIATPALPIIADLLSPHVSGEYLNQLSAVKYLANMCLVLELNNSLSNFYWLNVAEPDFPFVGVIEHTNFQLPKDYGGRHIVYLSKYLEDTNKMYHMNPQQIAEMSLPYIKRMFPNFDSSWVHRYYVWKTLYAQPVVGRWYGQTIVPNRTPIEGFYIATMAQIYPEDRGANYAIREGRRIAKIVADD